MADFRRWINRIRLPVVLILLATALSAAPLTNTPIALNAANGQQTLSATLVDSSGNPVNLSGYSFLWSFNDNGAILSINGPLSNGGSVPVTPVGSGTVTVTVQASKSGSTVSGTNTINVTGAPAGVVIQLQ